MARGKVRLEYIVNNSKRRATFRKRTDGIMKKINELSTLCGVDGCAIIYGENHRQAEIWPSAIGVASVLYKFMNFSEHERNKKMVDLDSFWMQSIEKAQEKYEKQMVENKKKDMADLIREYAYTGEYKIGDVSLNYLNELTTLIDNNLKEVDQRLESLEVQAQDEVVNGTEAMNGGNLLTSTSIAQVPNMGDVVDTHGYGTNMNYGLPNDEQLVMHSIMPPFDDLDLSNP